MFFSWGLLWVFQPKYSESSFWHYHHLCLFLFRKYETVLLSLFFLLCLPSIMKLLQLPFWHHLRNFRDQGHWKSLRCIAMPRWIWTGSGRALRWNLGLDHQKSLPEVPLPKQEVCCALRTLCALWALGWDGDGMDWRVSLGQKTFAEDPGRGTSSRLAGPVLAWWYLQVNAIGKRSLAWTWSSLPRLCAGQSSSRPPPGGQMGSG